MKKFLVILAFCQIMLVQSSLVSADDYSECRTRCESEYTDCTNEPPAADPEVQNAKMTACDLRLQSCYPDCDKFKPIENNYDGTQNNPNIIRK